MDTEKSAEVLDASETPQEDTAMEKEEKLEMTAESTEPENPPAAVEEMEQLAVNSHATEVVSMKEKDEPSAAENMTQENVETTIENSLEKSGMESVTCEMAPPKPDESSEKVSDPVEALTTEPENTEQPVPENKPEPLAESVPEPEPEKLAESVPETELQEQTSPVLATVQQPVDTQPPSQEEKGSEKVETEKELQTAVEPEAKMEATKMVLVTDVSSKEPTEAATVKKEASAEIESGEPQNEKEGNFDTSESAATNGAEPAVEAECADSEQKAEPQKEEDAVPASGSLSFALLEQEQTKDALRVSRTLVVLRGLPGSGLSFLARAITDSYKNQCSVICADDHGVKPENPESSADGYKALDEAVMACCSEGTASVLIVVDDTNHTHDRLARLGEIAEENNLVPIFLEPQTEWSRDVAQLKKKTKRGLEQAQLEAMKAPLEETSLPLYFGWFFLCSIEEKLRCTSMDFLKTLDTLDAFKKHLSDFTRKPEEEVDLEQYFQAKGPLHCTTKFCDYGKSEGAKEYAQSPAVKNSYGSVCELSMTALFVTPRTVGARVSLTEEQLQLWPADAEKQVEADVPATAAMPLGSRAHVTLGCVEGVEPVQTGIDLLQILALQQEGQQGEQVEEMELGSLAYYGEGRWLLSLREPIRAPACFSSFYGPKELEPAKKDPEKKKKQKCTIL
ncbi:2',3'-cyclic-nucleotide 3'-phosphodiesterase [Melanotaenia boesemani]|uniref:2',3'-cyclic-nucleotide 3'-phosphodiesterase n=1 Tax=Melanotaenia boesemani TaxID=1250792 RepID=UPI001C04C3C7|nr:2',3'-cyclic-nucleotide 3'-phosphodiesterase [Melanotaenia boesemani]XP_041824359.1 2',3'-cyclic-nucleotide 3'-phosphodiesterase [Melanotaenia boesemani]